MQQQSFWKKITTGKRKYALLAVILLVILYFTAFRGNGDTNPSNVTIVTRGSVSEEVLVTGTVKPMESVDLAFEKGGTVSYIRKRVGDKVTATEIIASLENGTEEAALQNAEAQLMSDRARYAELSKGSRPEEIRVKESELNKAVQDLASYYSNVPAIINDAYNKADNAVNKQADPIFSNDQTTNPELTFNASNQQYRNDAISARIESTKTLSDFRTLNDSVLSENKNREEMDAALTKARGYLLSTQSFMVKASAVLNSAVNLSESTLSTYKDNLATGRTNVNTALQSVSGAIDDIAAQKITVETTSRELELAKLGETEEVLSQQKSAILKAEANVKSAESNLRKTIIRSPITGIISRQDAKVGEIAGAGTKLISVISDAKYKIEANLPEADLAKVSLEDKAIVTMDTYGNSITFEATIVEIEPAETIIDGVSTYKITLTIDNPAKPVRSGMTANITIKTDEKKDVLVLPQRLIYTKNGNRFVRVLTQTGTEEIKVETGVRGTNGNIEIISGLNEGDRVTAENSN